MANGVETRKRRRRKVVIPVSFSIADTICLLLLSLTSTACIWVFGGNRLWIMAPMILIVILAAVLFIGRNLWSVYRYDLMVPPGGVWWVVFLLYLAAHVLVANIPYEAKLETFRYLSYVLAFWMWVNLLRVNHRWKWVLAALMLSVSVMAWYALIQDVHGTNMVLNRPRPEQYGMRASGSYICPNHFAHLLHMLIPVGIGVALYKGAGIPLRLIAGYTALMSLPPLYLTESRSGWIGLMVGVVVMLLAVSLRRGWRRFLLMAVAAPMVAALLGVGLWAISPRIQMRVEHAIQGDIRLPLWKDSIEMTRDHPLIGQGLGSFRWMYPHYQTHLQRYADAEFAHNDYLHFWIEIGAVGLAIAAIALLLVVRRALRVILADENGSDTYLMAGLLGMMAGSLAHAFFDFNFHIYGNVHVFVLLLGLLIAVTSNKRHDRIVATNVPRARWLAVASCLFLAAVTVFYLRAAWSYRDVLVAEDHKTSLKWDEAQAAYQRAVMVSPENWKAHLGLAHLMRTRSFWNRHPETRPAWIGMSREHYETALQLNPWAADAIYGLGSLYKMEKNQDKALEMRRLAVEKVPHNIFYLNELGLQYKDMGEFEKAYHVFRRSREIEPSPLAARNIEWLEKKLAAP